jgi:hypothetical protein
MRHFPVVALLLSAIPAAASDTTLPDYLPSETTAVIGIQVRGIVDFLQSQSVSGEWKTTGTQLMSKNPLPGFDPLKDLDEMVITTTGKGQNPEALILLRGRFDVARLPASATNYHGVPVVSISDPQDPKKKGAIAILDASNAIAGEARLVEAAIDRRGGSGLTEALAARIEPLRSKYAIWGIGDIPEQHGAANDAISSVDRFEFGANFAHGVELTADVHARSAKDAEKMASALALVQTMLKNGDTPLTGSEAELRTEDQWLKLRLRVPEEAMKKIIHDQAKIVQSAVLSRLAVPNSPLPVKPTTPSGGKMVKDAHGDTQVLMLPGRR